VAAGSARGRPRPYFLVLRRFDRLHAMITAKALQRYQRCISGRKTFLVNYNDTMMTFKYLRRRVSITQTHGNLRVKIAHSNQRGSGIMGTVLATAVMLLIAPTFIAPLHRAHWPMPALYVLLLLALLLCIYLIVLWISLWQAFGVEEIVVRDGLLRWKWKVLWLKGELDIPTEEIFDVKAITPWHGGNRVEFSAQSRQYRMREKILHDEATELAQALRRAVVAR
jgi:hypothetical protein